MPQTVKRVALTSTCTSRSGNSRVTVELPSGFRMETLDQEFLQRDSVVVLRIMRTVDQSHRAVTCCVQEWMPRIWIFFELDEVTPAELIPLRRIVVKPFPKSSAWSGIFQPIFAFQSM